MTTASTALVEARRRCVHDPDRRARVRRHARVGLDDDRRRRGPRRRRRSGSATRTPPEAAARAHRRARSPASSRTVDGRARAARGWLDCGARSGTSAGPASASWRSPRSTSRSGISRRACSACRSPTLLGRVRTTRCRSTAAAASARTSLERLAEQLGGWVEQGIPRVKMKVGREPDARPGASRRRARGDRRRRGALRRRQRRALAQAGASLGASLRARLGRDAGSRSRSPPTTSTGCGSSASAAAGSTSPPASTATSLRDFRNLVGAVDCLQADVTRCGGITGLLRGRRARAGARARPLGALRAAALGARVLRRRPAAPPRVLPRPRPRRAAALRRRARAGRRRAACPTARGPGTGSSSSARTRERWAA